jgi:hypothetical protein
MTTSDWILVLNGIAIVLAPIVALWIGGILQQRSDAQKAKLEIFSKLIGLRHTPLSAEMVQALNSIDAVFATDPGVREAWTRYLTTLLDQSLSTPLGNSIREEKRRALMLEIVKALGLTKKISSADLLRTYLPNFIAESTHVETLERTQKRAALEEDLNRRRIPFYPGPVMPTPTPVPQPTVSPVGNGAEQPR